MSLVLLIVVFAFAALLAPPLLLALTLRVVAAARTSHERPCRPSIRAVIAASRA